VEKYDFEESVGYWLAVCTNAMQRILSERLAPFGITFRQMQVIAWLMKDQQLSQSDLASLMMIEPPTLAGILSRMQTCGWINRTQCDKDRRKNWITATEKVQPIWSQIANIAKEVRAEATVGLLPEELSELFRMLKLIHKNLRSEQLVSFEAINPVLNN
jgi:MarR family transcriptional regulator, transcriptional regulator for hemolysin